MHVCTVHVQLLAFYHHFMKGTISLLHISLSLIFVIVKKRVFHINSACTYYYTFGQLPIHRLKSLMSTIELDNAWNQNIAI